MGAKYPEPGYLLSGRFQTFARWLNEGPLCDATLSINDCNGRKAVAQEKVEAGS